MRKQDELYRHDRDNKVDESKKTMTKYSREIRKASERREESNEQITARRNQ